MVMPQNALDVVNVDIHYEALAKEMEDNNPDHLRSDSDQNVDQLIVKPNLLAYVDRKIANSVDRNGLMSPAAMLAKFPSHTDRIRNFYKDQLSDPILKNSITAFLCRVPSASTNCQPFLTKNAPVKIVIDKLLKSVGKFKIYMIKHPHRVNDIIPIEKDRLLKMTQQEGTWFKHFDKSEDPYLRDVPQIAIWSQDGIVPAFACKVLRDSNKNIVRD